MSRRIGITALMALWVIGCGRTDIPQSTACASALECPYDTCQVPACTDEICRTTPAPKRAPCQDGAAKLCDGQGHCVECLLDRDCDTGEICGAHVCVPDAPVACTSGADCPSSEGPCLSWACIDQQCEKTFRERGADCGFGRPAYCDGQGDCVECLYDSHCPWRGNVCESPVCAGNTCGTVPMPTYSPCDIGGGWYCDGAARCVQCISSTDCGYPWTCESGVCVSPGCTLPANLGIVTAAQTAMGNDEYAAQGILNVAAVIDSATTVFYEIRDGSGYFSNGLRTGTVSLTGDQTNYNDCSMCVILQWLNPNNENDFQLYMPSSGQAAITALSPTLINSSLQNVLFSERELAAYLPPLPNGCTTSISSMPIDAQVSGVSASCGNGVKEAGELCDGADLGGRTCATEGFSGGTLSCARRCNSFVTTDCCKVPPSLGTMVPIVTEMYNYNYAYDDELIVIATLDGSTYLYYEIHDHWGYFVNGLRTGTISLTGNETDYNLCSFCVFTAWIDPYGTGDVQVHMANSGTAIISTLDIYHIDSTLQNVTLGEMLYAPPYPRVANGCTTSIGSITVNANAYLD